MPDSGGAFAIEATGSAANADADTDVDAGTDADAGVAVTALAVPARKIIAKTLNNRFTIAPKLYSLRTIYL